MKRGVGAWLACAAAMIGCGGATPTAVDAPVTHTTDDQRARELAPDLALRVDQADQALSQAHDDGDQRAAQDHAAQARLWRIALQKEAERIALERARADVMREVEAIETARIADESARAAIEESVRRERAAEIARTEATRVLTEAAVEEAGRRGGDAARVASRQQASTALLERARAALSAAVVMGLADAQRATAQQAIDLAARNKQGTSAAITAAQQAFVAAQRALSIVRQERGAVDDSEHAVLMHDLSAAGFAPELRDEGVVLWVADLFANGRAELRSGAAAQLETLGSVLVAHPHGPLQVQAIVHATVSPKLAQQRARRVQAALKVIAIERLMLIEAQSAADHANMVRITLPAYGCAAVANQISGCVAR